MRPILTKAPDERDTGADPGWGSALPNQNRGSPRSSSTTTSRPSSHNSNLSAAPSSASAGGDSFVPGWNWGASANGWSPKTTVTSEGRPSLQHHIRMQSSNFDDDSPMSSLGQGLIGLRRSPLADRVYTANDPESQMDDAGLQQDPLRERTIVRYGLNMEPPPGMDRVDMLLKTLALTNEGWSFGMFIAISSKGLFTIAGEGWHPASPFTPISAWRRCCETPNETLVLASPSHSSDTMRSSQSLFKVPQQHAKRHRNSDIQELSSRVADEDVQGPANAHQARTDMRGAVKAISLPPAHGQPPIPIGMVYAFAEHAEPGARASAAFVNVLKHVANLTTTGVERSTNSMRREKELLAQQALISMKRFVSGEMPSGSIAQESGELGMHIFSQAATSIRAILDAHACVIWDISCFRLFSLGSSNGSNKSDSSDHELGQSTWDAWNVRTNLKGHDNEQALAVSSIHVEGALRRHSSEHSGNQVVVAETVAEPSSAVRLSAGELHLGDEEDMAGSDSWTCSFPVTVEPVGVIGSSGGSLAHFKDLDGIDSRLLLAEFLATTRELGYHSRAQAEGEHIKTAETTLIGETSPLAPLLPSCCNGLIAVPIFEIDDQPAFMILVAFNETPVLEPADRHFVEQVGSQLLTWSIRARVKVVDQAQAHFIQRIQHELRTPLHAVIGTLEVLKDAIGESNMEGCGDDSLKGTELSALVDSAGISADALNGMINNILDFGALKAMPVNSNTGDNLPAIRWSEICSAISDTCVSEWMLAKQSGEFFHSTAMDMDVDDDDNSHAAPSESNSPELLFDFNSKDVTGDLLAAIDMEALKTVVRKLVNNAIRATRTGSIVVGLRVSGGRPTRADKGPSRNSRHGLRGDRHYDVEVTVEDTGKGMRKDFIESHLFAPYAKEDTFLPGSGLSLAIASRLVHRMGGHITMASSVEVGTKFTIILPVRFGHRRGGPSPSRSAVSSLRAPATFIGFDTQALVLTKELLMSRIKLDKADSLQSARILFVPAEAISSAAFREALSQLSQSGEQACPQLIVLERQDLLTRPLLVEEESLDDLVRRHGLSSFVEARKLKRPIDCRTYAKIEAIKERAIFAHVSGPTALRVASCSSEASGAGKRCGTPTSTESPCLSAPLNTDPEVACPFISMGDNGAKSKCTWSQSSQAFPCQEDGQHDYASIQATAAELAVEPATLQEVRVAADALDAPQDFIVMVVEDNPLNMKIMTTMLDRANINYIQAWNGKEAVEKFKEYLPQVVLLDITMPIMDGFQACTEIRKLRPAHLVRDDGSPWHRIIAVTALSSEADRLRGREAGMDDWLRKPLKMSNLMNHLKAWKASAISPVL